MAIFVIQINSVAQEVKLDKKTYTKKEGKWFQNWNGKQYEVNAKVITVKYKTSESGTKNDEYFTNQKMKVVRSNELGYMDISIPEGADPIDVVKTLSATGLFESVETNSYGEYTGTPNDASFSSQWGLNNTGQTGGTADADIDAVEAWDNTTGSSSIILAIIDSGTDWTHEDIGDATKTYNNLYFNPGEDAWSIDPLTNQWNPSSGNGIDDDGNGYIDDWIGWDFHNNNNDSRGTYNHGTLVAGVAGAKTNNSIGVAGISGGWGAKGIKLMILGIGDNNPDETVLDDAILYACSKGAKFISLSLTIPQTSAIDAALSAAYLSYGCFINAAAGNSGSAVEYPATNQYCLAVGATDHNDVRASFSNYGSSLAVVAPGVNILSTSLNNTYASASGTSLASPHVAGIAVLCKSVNSSLTNVQIANIIKQTADDKGTSGRDDYYGYGRVNAKQAVMLALAYAGKSLSSEATYYNGKRQLYKESYLHEVFTSGTVDGGEIYYRQSSDNGTTWNTVRRLSDGTMTSLAPSIMVTGGYNIQVASWQQKNGSNYDIIVAVSTDGGSNWTRSTVQSGVVCDSPGPLPSLAANINTQSVVLTYRSSSGMRYVYSTNYMTSWSVPATISGTSSANNSPSSAFNNTFVQTNDRCNLAYATATTYASQMYFNEFSFSTNTWSAATNLSSILPTTYQEHKNPSVGVTRDNNGSIIHVAWESTLFSPPTPVIIHRTGTASNFGSQYYVISSNIPSKPSITGLTSSDAWMVYKTTPSGIYKIKFSGSVWGTSVYINSGNYPQLSIGPTNPKYTWTSVGTGPYDVNISSEVLSKESSSDFDYFREINFINPENQASISLEIKQPVIIHKDGTYSLIPFVSAPEDSVTLACKDVLSYGKTEDISLPDDIDILKIEYTVRKSNDGKIANLYNEPALTFCNSEKASSLISAYTKKVENEGGIIYSLNITADILNNAGIKDKFSVSFNSDLIPDESSGFITSIGHIFKLNSESASGYKTELADSKTVPEKYMLEQNYPNPFNPVTNICYSLPEAGMVELKVFDALGSEVADLVNEVKSAGKYNIVFNAGNLASGIYYCRLKVNGFVTTNKMVLLK